MKSYKVNFYGLKLIKSKISEYLILILLKPEWEARKINLRDKNKKNNCLKLINNHVKVIFDKNYRHIHSIHLKVNYDSKNLNIINLAKTIDISIPIQNKFNIWINKHNFIYQNIVMKYLKKENDSDDSLYSLLQIINYLGLEWFMYINNHSKYFYKYFFIFAQNINLLLLSNILTIDIIKKNIAQFLNLIVINLKNIKCNIYTNTLDCIYLVDIIMIIKNNYYYLLKPSKSSLNNLIKKIRIQLYHKNHQGYWRINHNINLKQALKKIKNILNSWFLYYKLILQQSDIFEINTMINNVFYIWQIKQYT